MKNCRIHTGCNNDIKLILVDTRLFGEENNLEVISAWDDENEDSYIPSNLKDISIIMRSMVGQGVTWQLASVLSEKLNINNPALVSDVLFSIFREYSELSDEEAFDKYESSPKLYDPMT
jgi:hypothetical protein